MILFGKEIKLSALLRNKKFVTTISIIGAVLFWAFINISESPNISKELRNVPVVVSIEDTVAESMGLEIVDKDEEYYATVAVSGPRYVVSTLSAEDITITASMEGVTSAGESRLRLVAAKNGTNTNYSIDGIYPETVSVFLDELVNQPMTPEAVLEGGSVSDELGFDISIVGLSENGTINISGPKTLLEQVARVVVSADVGGTVTETKAFEATIKYYNANGEEMDDTYFTADIENPKVTVSVYKTKFLPVRAVFTNAPEKFAQEPIAHTLSIEEIIVKGDPAVIDAMDAVTLSPIDFSSISASNREFKCTPVLRMGVEASPATEEVVVKITSNIKEKSFDVASIRATGLDVGKSMEVIGSKKNITVTVCGSSSSIDNLRAADLYGIVDLSGKSAGESTAQVRVFSDKFGDVWSSGTNYISIKIS